jgi:hypothetical protein
VAAAEAEKRRWGADRPPPALAALVERFDPEVIDVPSGEARIRLVVNGDGEWDAVIELDAIDLQPASDEQPDGCRGCRQAVPARQPRTRPGCEVVTGAMTRNGSRV